MAYVSLACRWAMPAFGNGSRSSRGVGAVSAWTADPPSASHPFRGHSSRRIRAEFAELTTADRARAAVLWSKGRGVVAGVTASALHGAKWVDDDEPVELIWRNQHAPRGVITRNERLDGDEFAVVDGISVTTAARTALDLGRHLDRDAAVTRLDALAHATGISAVDVEPLLTRHRGSRGVQKAREAIALMDAGGTSPKETWLRLLIVDAGLPKPQSQLMVHNGDHYPLAYLDLGWEKLHGRRGVRRRPTSNGPSAISEGRQHDCRCSSGWDGSSSECSRVSTRWTCSSASGTRWLVAAAARHKPRRRHAGRSRRRFMSRGRSRRSVRALGAARSRQAFATQLLHLGQLDRRQLADHSRQQVVGQLRDCGPGTGRADRWRRCCPAPRRRSRRRRGCPPR